MLVILDNVLDPQKPKGQEICEPIQQHLPCHHIPYHHHTTWSRAFRRPHNIWGRCAPGFHRIYDNDERPDVVNKILEQLDFHPRSVALLTTVAHQNGWDNDRLAREWTLKQLVPGARDRGHLGVITLPVNEGNLDWLFPTIPNLPAIFDTLCILSLTYRRNGFIAMLVPLRDYLCPKYLLPSALYCTTKRSDFSRFG